MQGKIRAVLGTAALAVGLLAVGVGPALASGTPQPCTDALHCSGGISATVVVNTEETLTLTTTTISMGPAAIAGVASTPTSGSTAEVAGVSSYDNNGYTVNLLDNAADYVHGTTDGSFIGANNPADKIGIDGNLSVLQGSSSTPYPSGGAGDIELANIPTGGWTGGTGCSHAAPANGNPAGAGCTEDAVNHADDWAFGMSLSIAASVPADSYSAPFTVALVGS